MFRASHIVAYVHGNSDDEFQVQRSFFLVLCRKLRSFSFFFLVITLVNYSHPERKALFLNQVFGLTKLNLTE